MQKRLPHILVILLFGLLFLPMTQLALNLFDEPKLEGIAKTAVSPTWRWSDWMKGSFQDTLTEYANQHCGFHSTMVRLNNQYYYTVFNTAITNHVVIGKQGYLYDKAHIAAFTGSDFLGNDSILSRVEAIRDLREILGKKGIRLMLVLLPGKGTGVPEFLPEGTPPAGQQTNYKSYQRLTDSLQLPTLDLVAWYKLQKNVSPYPLYPSGGIHWSQYCATIAADTLLGFIEQQIQTPLNRFEISEIEYPAQPRGEDGDIDRGMNLLFPNSGYPMAYPKVKWKGIDPKFSVMTVGDSYYFKAFTDFTGAAFAKSSFWFYHNELHTLGNLVIRSNDEVDIIREIESNDLIILYCADANLKLFSWGFVEDALRAYRDPVRREAEIDGIVANIRKDPNWLQVIQHFADSTHLPLDSLLRANASYVFETARIR